MLERPCATLHLMSVSRISFESVSSSMASRRHQMGKAPAPVVGETKEESQVAAMQVAGATKAGY
jgi:hypothetical protein